MVLSKLREFLDANEVKYQVITHSRAYTAQEIASRAHIPGQELAKTVIVKIDGELAMIIVPASQHVNLATVRVVAESETARLATELEFKDRFPQCDTGAMPPFGNLFGMAVFADESLAQDEEIAFNAGSHTELVRLALADFRRLVNPVFGKFATGKVARAAAGEDRMW